MLEKDEDAELPLPPIEWPEVVSFFHRAGPTMGGAALTATELRAWSKGVQQRLSPWEFETVLYMSGEFVNMYAQAKDPAMPPPWADIPDDDRRAVVSKQTKKLFRS